MTFGFWIYIFECYEVVAFLDYFCRDFFLGDFAEDAVWGFHFSNFLDALRNMIAAKICVTKSNKLPTNIIIVEADIM